MAALGRFGKHFVWVRSLAVVTALSSVLIHGKPTTTSTVASTILKDFYSSRTSHVKVGMNTSVSGLMQKYSSSSDMCVGLSVCNLYGLPKSGAKFHKLAYTNPFMVVHARHFKQFHGDVLCKGAPKLYSICVRRIAFYEHISRARSLFVCCYHGFCSKCQKFYQRVKSLFVCCYHGFCSKCQKFYQSSKKLLLKMIDQLKTLLGTLNLRERVTTRVIDYVINALIALAISSFGWTWYDILEKVE